MLLSKSKSSSVFKDAFAEEVVILKAIDGVVVVVMSINLLEHFIQWQRPTEMLQFAGALAVVAGALAIFVRFRCSVSEANVSYTIRISPGAESKENPENMQ